MAMLSLAAVQSQTAQKTCIVKAVKRNGVLTKKNTRRCLAIYLRTVIMMETSYDELVESVFSEKKVSESTFIEFDSKNNDLIDDLTDFLNG